MPGRVDSVQHAERVNAAADLVGAGVPAAEAARSLAGRFGCSVRQARRYVDQAVAGGTVAGPEPGVGFTVKLPGRPAAAGPAPAREAGPTTSQGVCQR